MRSLALLLGVGLVGVAAGVPAAHASPTSPKTSRAPAVTIAPETPRSGHALARAPRAGATAATSSSLHWYGDYDPATGAAVENGTWTFDHGAPDPLEGWSIPKTFDGTLPWRRIDATSWSGHLNGPPAPVIAGTASYWLGYFEDEACLHQYLAGLGYGNDWDIELRSAPMSVAAGTPITVSFDCFYDMEPLYDSLAVFVLQGTTRTQLGRLTGKMGSPAAPYHVSYPYVVPSSDGFRILFTFHSDATYSDQDSIYATDLGPFGLDNLDVQGMGLVGRPAPPYDFESGEQGVIVSAVPAPSLGGLSNLSSYGSLVDCSALSGNVLKFHDSLLEHPYLVAEVLESNAVPLPSGAGPLNVFADFDLDSQSQGDIVGIGMGWSYYPDTCPLNGAVGWSRQLGRLSTYTNANLCGRVRSYATDTAAAYTLYGASADLIPAHSDSVRAYIRVLGFTDPPSGPTPWPLVDNIRIGFSLRETVLGVPSPSYPTIQSAIDAADPGDTVMVAAGVYRGPGNRDLDFHGKSIVLLGEEGSAATIVDAEHVARGIGFSTSEGPAAEVNGFTFRNGDGSGTEGGAIRVDNASPTFVDCVAESSVTIGLPGGGLFLNGDAHFIGCRFEQDSTQDAGGGIFVAGGGPYFEDCVASGNGCDGSGGGIFVAAGAPTFLRCQVTGNRSMTVGGGVLVSNGDPVFQDCTVADNQAPAGGAGASVQGGAPVWLGGEVTGNFTVGPGGGFDFAGGVAFVQDCWIAGNVGTEGGGLRVEPAAAPSFNNCLVAGNYAGANGGGASLEIGQGQRPEFTSCTIARNRCGGTGGGLRVVNTAGGPDVVSVGQTILEGNCAATGADLRVETVNAASGVTFACCAVDSTQFVSDGTITFVDGHVTAPPLFCAAEPCASAPTLAGDYSIASNSPCAQPVSPCGGLIGARDVGCGTLAVDDGPGGIPASTRLLGSSPNPFHRATLIRFDLSRAARVRLRVFDLSGRLLRTLVSGWQPASRHEIAWDGRDDSGRRVANGVCFVRLDVDGRSYARKVLLVR